MTRVFLVNATDLPFTASCLMPDNGLASLAACLRAAGHEVEIHDLGTIGTMTHGVTTDERALLRAAWSELGSEEGPARTAALSAATSVLDTALARLYARLGDALSVSLGRSTRPVLGLKLWFGASTRAALTMAAALARRHPGLRVVAGGPVATLAASWLLREFPILEAVCVGDGEEAIVGVAEAAATGAPFTGIPNLLHRDGARLATSPRRFVDPNALPLPCYDADAYPAMAPGEKLAILSVDESRGCPMRCPFCTHACLSGARWRVLTAERVVALLAHARRTLGVRAFRFSGSLTPGRLYREIAERLPAVVPDALLSGFAHVNAIRPEDFPVLAAAGVVALFFGVESGAARLLEGALGKRTTPARVRTVLTACMDAGIFACGSVIYPAPGEDRATGRETLRLLAGTFAGRSNGAAVLQPAFPLPGSAWWRDMPRYGFGGDPGRILRALVDRRAHRLLAPDAGPPMGLTLDGRPFEAAAAATDALARTLAIFGVRTNVSDDLVLLARAARLDVDALRTFDREVFATLDAERARELVARVHEA